METDVMRDIAFLVYPGYSLMALAIVAGFEVANSMVDPTPYELRYVSRAVGPLKTSPCSADRDA